MKRSPVTASARSSASHDLPILGLPARMVRPSGMMPGTRYSITLNFMVRSAAAVNTLSRQVPALDGAAAAAGAGVSGVHSGASKHTSANLPALRVSASSQSLTSPFSGRSGNRTMRTVLATPCKACAASCAFLRPASSLSSRMRQLRPASGEVQSGVQSPPATVVAQ
jgi:hypothetical protein